MSLGEDGIFSYPFANTDQSEEIELRESVADQQYDDYLAVISKHHSIRVMDNEVSLFLDKIPLGGSIVDVGGCWGWHWRNVTHMRPDLKIYIVDFIRSNLYHASKVLGKSIGKNIFLIHGDATNLIFEENELDGYWSVQTLQHIPDYEKAIKEAFRILRPGGVLANYSLNVQSGLRLIYRILGKNYHVRGVIPGKFYLARASTEQLDIVETIFSNEVIQRYTEVIFIPELKVKFTGREDSFFGLIDAYLSNKKGFFSSVARQQSFHTSKT
jgi:ubiquinone/menaquinone biosynthesis C-methylase UbiE